MHIVNVSNMREAPITAFTSNNDVLDLWQPFAMAIDARSVHVFDLESGLSLGTSSDECTETFAQASAIVRVT